MTCQNTALMLVAATLLLAGCKNSGDDAQPVQPIQPNPPAVNLPPTANAGVDQQVLTGAAVSLNGSGSDTDGSIATLAWTQTGGTAVTMTGANTGTPTFTAPAAAGMLVFQLTVSDNQGATHADSVTVSVSSLAAPVIARHPANVVAYEHGIALLFVAAQGENLNYEWHYSSGALWTSGPEPYMVRGGGAGLQMSSDGDCYYVIVSNAAGSVTSEEGCLTVVEIEGDMDPSDDDPLDNGSLAQAWGDAMLSVSFAAAGPHTGGGFPGNHSMVPHLVGPGNRCPGGEVLAATLDGVAVTQATALPLGQHTITQVWDDCENGDPDEPRVQSGGVMISYDFPTIFGEGTYTMYFSGHGERHVFSGSYEILNGILHVTNARSVGPTGLIHDEIEMTLEPYFCAGPLREEPHASPSTIRLDRRYDDSGTVATDAEFDFDVSWNAYEWDGWLGTVYGSIGAGSVELHYIPNAGDGEISHTSDDYVEVRMAGSDTWYLGRIRASGDATGWRFVVDEPEGPQFPGDDD